jgi:hypothetical protein
MHLLTTVTAAVLVDWVLAHEASAGWENTLLGLAKVCTTLAVTRTGMLGHGFTDIDREGTPVVEDELDGVFLCWGRRGNGEEAEQS